jgi:radical SAM protein with 4Fe4S-binding SPASM domain
MKFKRIYIEITNHCNLTCDFCAVSKRDKRFMSIAEFEMICDQIRFLTEHIYLHVQGEPLLHPQIEEILRIAHARHLQVQLVTNGTLLSENMDILLNAPAIRQISVSLQSLQTIGYLENEINRNRLFENLIRLSEIGKYVQLRLWNFSDQVFTDGINSCLAYFDVKKDELLIEKKRYLTRFANIYFSLDRQFQWPSDPSSKTTIGHCYGTRSMLGILSDGTLVPCCLDHDGAISLGNVFITPVAELIKSERFITIQSGFNQKQITEPFCQHCQYRQRFD